MCTRVYVLCVHVSVLVFVPGRDRVELYADGRSTRPCKSRTWSQSLCHPMTDLTHCTYPIDALQQKLLGRDTPSGATTCNTARIRVCVSAVAGHLSLIHLQRKRLFSVQAAVQHKTAVLSLNAQICRSSCEVVTMITLYNQTTPTRRPTNQPTRPFIEPQRPN